MEAPHGLYFFVFASFNSVKCICLLCIPETVNKLHAGSEEPFDYFCVLWVFQLWDMFLAKVDEDLNNADFKQAVKELLAEGFENKMGLVGIVIQLLHLFQAVFICFMHTYLRSVKDKYLSIINVVSFNGSCITHVIIVSPHVERYIYSISQWN